MSSPNVRAKAKPRGIVPALGTRTSPRTNRNPYATGTSGGRRGNVVAAAITSGGTTAVARGGGHNSEDDVPPPPARALSFATPRAEVATQSVSSLSWSTKTHSTKTSGGKRNLNAANLSQPKKKVKQGEDDGDVSIQDGKEDKDIDFVPITDQAMDDVINGMGTWERDDIEHGIKMHHASSPSIHGKSFSCRTWSQNSC